MIDKNLYIKVTTKGGKSFVLLAGNKHFYKAQGCAITEPTEKEIMDAFPEVKEREERLAAATTKTVKHPKDENTKDGAPSSEQQPVDNQPAEKAKKTPKTSKAGKGKK